MLGLEGQLASCIYGYSGPKGREMGSTFGWPDLIEGWPNDREGPEPMTVEEIVKAVSALCPKS